MLLWPPSLRPLRSFIMQPRLIIHIRARCWRRRIYYIFCPTLSCLVRGGRLSAVCTLFQYCCCTHSGGPHSLPTVVRESHYDLLESPSCFLGLPGIPRSPSGPH
ncbi:hypothetical protein L596_014986 [Steinernema carpocapsae]|uniref:Uncharacterized protein n=1 Tax=Steinernema carpocapsae TaxID=34508 RepID=A0A4U5NEJ7_STECR|nr:hypothetical protein L596_014986 [Steinernema carpocapsae]